MGKHRGLSLLAALAAGLGGCASLEYPLPHYEEAFTRAALTTPDPDPRSMSRLDAAQVRRGRHLVDITGCAACHTDGALIGEPNPARSLAGSELGIAYTNPQTLAFPGVAYPINLTPDPVTGLGRWSDAEIIAAIREGRDLASPRSGHLAIMAWPLYQHLTDEEASAVVAYLRSIPSVEHRVPARVRPGTRAPTPYVYFGVYRSGPAIDASTPIR